MYTSEVRKIPEFYLKLCEKTLASNKALHLLSVVNILLVFHIVVLKRSFQNAAHQTLFSCCHALCL